MDPILANLHYAESRSLISELDSRLSHSGPIFKNGNVVACMSFEEADRGTSVKSTIKSFSLHKDGRGAFQSLISNHADEAKYRETSKKMLNIL